MEYNLLNYFNFLPDEIILNIVIYLPIDNIANLCLMNHRFNDIICDNNYFWKQKYKWDYGDVNFEIEHCYQMDNNVTNIPCWKYFYFNSKNVWKFSTTNEILYFQNLNALDVELSDGYSIIIDINNNVLIFTHYDNNLYKLDIKAKKIYCSKEGIDATLIDLDDNVWVAPTWGKYFRGPSRIHVIISDTWTKISNIKAKEISVGTNHTALIDLDNNIWVSGNNSSGQLGLGDNYNRNEFIKISNFKAKKIACGDRCTGFIDLQNNIWTFGFNGFGQLGLGDYINRNIPTKIGQLKGKIISMSTQTMIIDQDGKMLGCGCYTSELNREKNKFIVPTPINKYKVWKDVSASSGRITALDEKNNVWVSDHINQYQNDSYRLSTFQMLPGYKAFKIVTGYVDTIFIGMKI